MSEPISGHVYIMYGNQNKYSWSSLVGALESRNTFKACNLELVVFRGTVDDILAKVNDFPEDRFFVMFSGSSFYARSILQDVKILAEFKKTRDTRSRLITIVGGPHATAKPSEFIAAGADFVFIQEGEEAITDFFTEFHEQPEQILASDGFTPRNTPNCYFKRDKRDAGTITKIAPTIDLDQYPPFAETNRLFRPIEISRGCPHGCKYCQTSNLFGREMRHRSIENIVKWTRRAVELKYDKLWVTTPNAFAYGSKGGIHAQPGKIETLLRELHGIEGLDKIFFGSFPSEVRPEFVTNEIMDIISPYIANKNIVVGVQSASPRILKHANRGHTIDDVWNAIDVITSRGFLIDLDMIFGLPTEGMEDVQYTIDFIKEVMRNPLTRIHGHAFMPLPGTAFESEKPGEIAREVMKIIGHYAKEKRVYGAHFHQVYRARRIKRASEEQGQGGSNQS